MSGLSSFRFVRAVGTVLTGDALASASELRMPGQSPGDYQVPPGMGVNAAIARAWDAMLAAYREWHTALDKLPAGEPATKVTREKWLLPLLYELGWGRVENVSGGLDVEPGLGENAPLHFPISHRWSYPDASAPTAWVPIHLVGAQVHLDTKTPSVAARAPQSMVQDYLNRESRALWAVVSNGRQLRLLRDASALSRQSYVEFDLDEIFANQLYSDFRLLFLTAHSTRFAPRITEVSAKQTVAVGDDDTDSDAEPPTARLDDCWLERWRIQAIDVGSRARLNLQHGIAVALELLGNGFLACPENTTLRKALAGTHNADRDLHRALLRIAYRLIVLFVAEDRELLHTTDVKTEARENYSTYFSSARLRRLATTHAGGRYTDLWEAHQIVTDALAGQGLAVLGLPGLGASLFGRDFLGILDGARLPNHALLAAIKALSQIEDPVTGTPRNVDYRNLDSEEFGGMYEGLLAYTPRYDPTDHTFTLDHLTAGNERKKSGSYYTPSELIDVVLAEALDPLIDEARHAPDPQTALLELTVVDPACGSGHFVVAAGRRIATALAEVRTGDTEPSPADVRAATADVIERCLYGVDLNDLAIEITKVALWLEAFDAGRPLPFLDAHFRVGNALLGTTPELLKHNVPDTAFAALGDDDKTWTTKLRARNKAERKADADQLSFEFGAETLNVETAQFHRAAQEADTGTIADLATLRVRADAWRKLESSLDLKAAKLLADAWCAAFVQPKTGAQSSGHGITYATLRNLSESPQTVSDNVIRQIRELARQYRFFHWHLEFPGIFTVGGADTQDATTSWSGGFSCVIGNPPWETLQLEDKQFFSNLGRSDISEAPNAAARKKLIASLATSDPHLYKRYREAARESEATTHLVRGGRYPLTATGKINTYSVFAETMCTIVGSSGAAGIITPTGLATDSTTAAFFANTLSAKRLYAFYDFENEAKIFRDVHHSYRFSVTVMTGPGRSVSKARFAFLIRHIADLDSKRFALAPNEVLRMNPNTGTLPMFRSRIDADITLGIYDRHRVLIRDDDPSGNLWRLSFSQGLFNLSSDADLFRPQEDLADLNFNGWSYKGGGKEFLPLYEAKMFSHYDHRFSTYSGATPAQLNVRSLPRISEADHDDPDVEPLARYWVDRSEVKARLAGKWDRNWLLAWRDVTRANNERSFVPSVIPCTAAGNSILLAFPGDSLQGILLHAVWSTYVFDYVARQKQSGTHMQYFITKQLACPKPAVFEDDTPWQRSTSLREWVKPYVLELTYTSARLAPYAKEFGDDGAPFHWRPERRALLRADLDAGFFHVYELDRDEAEHVLDSFTVVRKYDERDFSEFRTKRLVLEAYDRMATAISNNGKGWKPLADVPAGSGPRHRKGTLNRPITHHGSK